MARVFGERFRTYWIIFAILLVNLSLAAAQQAQPAATKKDAPQVSDTVVVERGKLLFGRDCAFCHGRDAGGGETGPDLTRSRLVRRDPTGEKIRAVVQSGRPEKGMPPFSNLSVPQINDLIAFVRDQTKKMNANPGIPRGVDVADLQTGNIEAGKAYFNGVGGCSSCHSASGDLAGVGTRYVGLELEKRMLYPENAKAKLTVTLTSGQTLSGVLAYKDEFHVAMIDTDGWYKSWPTREIQYKVDAPAEAHVEQFEKYTDDDIHNLMAYLQTLK